MNYSYKEQRRVALLIKGLIPTGQLSYRLKGLTFYNRSLPVFTILRTVLFADKEYKRLGGYFICQLGFPICEVYIPCLYNSTSCPGDRQPTFPIFDECITLSKCVMIQIQCIIISGLVGFEPYGMTVPKTVALPLGYNPIKRGDLAVGIFIKRQSMVLAPHL